MRFTIQFKLTLSCRCFPKSLLNFLWRDNNSELNTRRKKHYEHYVFEKLLTFVKSSATVKKSLIIKIE